MATWRWRYNWTSRSQPQVTTTHNSHRPERSHDGCAVGFVVGVIAALLVAVVVYGILDIVLRAAEGK